MGEFDYIFLTGTLLDALNLILHGNYNAGLAGHDMVALMVKIILLLFRFVWILLDMNVLIIYE